MNNIQHRIPIKKGAAPTRTVLFYAFTPLFTLWLLAHIQGAMLEHWIWDESIGAIDKPSATFLQTIKIHAEYLYLGGYTPRYRQYHLDMMVRMTMLNILLLAIAFNYKSRVSKRPDLFRNPLVNRMRFKLKGYDMFYSDIPLDLLPRYQFWFDKIIEATKQSEILLTPHINSETGKLFISQIVLKVAEEAAREEGLHSKLLKVMFGR